MLVKYNIRTPIFVLNLVRILSEPNYSHMIAWEQSGTRFIIKDSLEFASKVLPQYYETSKLTSFTRQLNIYGFERVSDRRRTKESVVASSIIYSHQYFKRDQPDFLHLIQRISGPYSKVRTKTSIHGQSRGAKSTLLPLPPSPALSSTSLVTSHSISPERCDLTCTKDTAVDCLSCTALKREVVTLRKTIGYYKSLIENSANNNDIPSNGKEARALDISQSLIPSFTLPVSPEEASLGVWANSNFNKEACTIDMSNTSITTCAALSLWANSDPNVYSYTCPYPSPMEDF
ncbi:hypothetical protein K7432_013696 [Basidiobolus ranarum]|uniref:HSF-type DNA-binding domain-containing protein n=1 Tax=Basidiobolus ranarum TaxID=34480 RepID=A0ABR2WIT9_9FUNG